MFRLETYFLRSIALGLVCLAQGTHAAPVQPSGEAGHHAVEGILVNQTVTVAGQEFHAAFAGLWADKPDVTGYWLAIRERPSPRRGTTVEVEHNNRIVFSAWLPPSRAQVRPLAEQAVEAVYQQAVTAQLRGLMRDDDLAPDEI